MDSHVYNSLEERPRNKIAVPVIIGMCGTIQTFLLIGMLVMMSDIRSAILGSTENVTENFQQVTEEITYVSEQIRAILNFFGMGNVIISN